MLKGGTWHPTAELSMGAQMRRLGVSVALSASGTTALVGALGQTAQGPVGGGAAEVFVYRSGQWRPAQELDLAGRARAGDYLGASVSLDAAGTKALIGAPGRTEGGVAQAGAAELHVHARRVGQARRAEPG